VAPKTERKMKIKKHQEIYKKALEEAYKEYPNLDIVLKKLHQAIEMGSYEACYALGSWYLHGKNVEKNLKKAVAYFKKASEGNVVRAFFDLAVSYETGIGVKKDPKKALEFYLKAAVWGDQQSFYEIGRCYYYGIGIEKNKRIGKIWLERAAALGYK
jgi:TPR repeat protein